MAHATGGRPQRCQLSQGRLVCWGEMRAPGVRFSLMLVATLAAMSTASAPAATVPPGNSAADQYTESYPGPGGSQQVDPNASGSPAQVLGPENAARLRRLGAKGREAAALLAATAPDGGGRDASGLNQGASGKGGDPGIEDSGGSSSLAEIAGQATGASSSGEMGLLLPLVIAGAVVASVAYLWRRRRRTV